MQLQHFLSHNKANINVMWKTVTSQSPHLSIPWKHPIIDSRHKREFGNTDKTHSHLNLKPVMNLEHKYLFPETLAQNTLDSQDKASNKMTSII